MCCLLLIVGVYCLLPVACCSLVVLGVVLFRWCLIVVGFFCCCSLCFLVRWLLFVVFGCCTSVVRCALFVVWCSMCLCLACLLLVICCMVCVSYCFLFTVRRLMSVVWLPLRVECLLFVVRC